MEGQAEVAFHFNVADPVHYLCRLLRKASQAGMRSLVCAPAGLARELDQALWTFAPDEFIAHARWSDEDRLRARSGVLIADQAVEWPGAQVLVNALPSPELPPGYAAYRKVIEVVGLEAQDREAARRRWKAYTARGHALLRHDVAAPAGAA
ncbi:MAG: hypothetical protein RJA36_420 [Pseudomonadota bacterium]|jgi:DNA polymerase-3 subunit chi